MLTLGEKIRTARENANMSPQELAKSIGISQPYMSQIENNARTPGRDKLVKIANVLRIPLDYLVRSDLITIHPKESKNEGSMLRIINPDGRYVNYYSSLDKAEKAGLSEQQIKDAIEFAIKMKTQA